MRPRPPLPAPRIPPRRAGLALAVVGLVSLAGGVLPAFAPSARARAPATAPEPGFDAALDRFLSARPGDEKAIGDAANQFVRLSAAEPTDPVLRAYAGAATSMRATTTMLPWKKISYTEDGLSMIDKALAQLTPAHDAASHAHSHQGVPAVLWVRLTAANTFLALPSMFNRNERGRAQLRQVTDSPLLEAAPAGFKAAAWMSAASLAGKDQQPTLARHWLEKVAATSTPQAAVAREKLKAL